MAKIRNEEPCFGSTCLTLQYCFSLYSINLVSAETKTFHRGDTYSSPRRNILVTAEKFIRHRGDEMFYLRM